MAISQVVKLSKNGRLTIPSNIVKGLGMVPLNRFFIVGERDCIILKKIQNPSAKECFQSLADKATKQFEEKGVTMKDVEEAISWARKSK